MKQQQGERVAQKPREFKFLLKGGGGGESEKTFYWHGLLIVACHHFWSSKWGEIQASEVMPSKKWSTAPIKQA
jgi:hypothetical protein